MLRSGLLFGILTLIGIIGAGGIIVEQVLEGEQVSAQPVSPPGILYGFPVTGRARIAEVNPKEVFQLPTPLPSQPPTQREDATPPPVITAQAALVVDAATEAVLYEKSPDARQSLASITKLLAAITIEDMKPNWSATTTIGNGSGLGRHFLFPGDVVTLRDLLFTSVVGSSNSAIVELADAVMPTSTSFVAKMRLKAEQLNLTTVFVDDPAGLSTLNTGTAHDVIYLIRAAFERPIVREALQTQQYDVETETGEIRSIDTTNWLLSGKIPLVIKRVLGGKTGHLPEAGYNFVVAMQDELGHELYVVILGAEDHYARFNEAQALAEWVYQTFEWLPTNY